MNIMVVFIYLKGCPMKSAHFIRIQRVELGQRGKSQSEQASTHRKSFNKMSPSTAR